MSHLKLILCSVMLTLIALPTKADARPKAADGEPEIMKDGKDLQGRDAYRQVFTGAQLNAKHLELSIAQVYYVFGSEGVSFDPLKIKVRCNILPSGLISRYRCDPDQSASQADRALYDAILASGAFPDLPKFRPLDKWTGSRLIGNDWAHYRVLEFDLSTPPISFPKIDLTGGREVDRTIVDVAKLFRRVAMNYPSRALRQELEGALSATCQIQDDLSVICSELGFDPPENLPTFEREFLRQVQRIKANPTLLDGSDARGARFDITFGYYIG